MSVCKQIYADSRHNDRQFAAMMAQRLKEQISETRNPGKKGGRPSKYANDEERKAATKQQRKEREKAARLRQQVNGTKKTVDTAIL